MEAASRAATTVSDRVYELEVLVRELEAYIEAATLTPVAAADPQTLEIDRQAVTSAAATLAYMRCRLLLSNGESSVLDLRYEHFAQPSHGRPKHLMAQARQLPGLMRLKDEEAMTLRHQVEDAQTTRTQLTQQLHEASLARCVMLKASSSQRERRTCTQLLAENEASIANILSQHKLKEAKQYLDAFERHLSASLTLVTTQLR
ncbi:uncharacterized protein MONBRDRAFT_7677 [Monosiga brevicollis MX1]|uniref:Uncharacterized protein n=1 Tax=Monosiga brevicollis TaxID=81824 RepID=A9UXZ7_MONBE|nr:uncharacterized protein MONBRDRAFT_7677 [Monosiga brevicollis MX1]EDQ89933.1 predicted protein [Monosiga brevicollis MX1]|eukprot:XP_001745355.1 hypothetical protein [Monosiga brevicollis MX1]